ncbi:hypothetical protein BJ912DRAFT_1009669 [Pholiota molesta]|nr:hypothetical protein BJ912DRAFT_1009669 [Pholiota molesta]
MPSTHDPMLAIHSKISDITMAYGTPQFWISFYPRDRAVFNPPSLWITINPADTQDPIAQFIAGISFDLDNFCNKYRSTSTKSKM